MNKSPSAYCQKLFPDGFKPESGFVEPALDQAVVFERLNIPRRGLRINDDGTPFVVPDRIDGEPHIIEMIQMSDKSECWPWVGRRDNYGYAQIKLGTIQTRAHRLIYALVYGCTPPELCVCHRCDNKPCVNPYHFFIGTKADNNWDKAVKGRVGERIGSKHHKAKLTEGLILEIRQKATGKRGEAGRLAGEFGISGSTMRRILNGELWKHVR